MKILIVGAGLAGLYQAYLLSKKNYEIDILEKKEDSGGLLKTIQYSLNGEKFYFDIGPHVPPKYHESWNFLCSKVDSITVPLPIRVSIKLEKDLELIYPPDVNLIRVLKLSGLLYLSKYLIFYLFSSIYKIKETNLEQSLINSWGLKFYKNYIFNFISTFWKAHPRIITKKYKLRFKPPSISTSFKKILENIRFSSENLVPKNIYLYPKYGVGEVIDFLETDLIKRGVNIKKSSYIVSMKLKNGIADIKYKQNNKIYEESYEKVYWAGSILDLVNIMHLKEFSNLIYRKLLIINLSINRKTLLPAQVHTSYIMIPHILFHRIYEPKKLSPFMAPSNKTSACLEITLKSSKYNIDQIKKIALKQFKRLYNVNEKEIKHLGNLYYEEAYPFMFIDYENYYDNLITTIKNRFPNFYFIGRTGQFFPYTVGQTLDSLT